MRKLVLLVGVVAISGTVTGSAGAQSGIIPTWEAPSKQLGFYPVCNEISLYKNVDDSGADRGETLQFVLIDRFRLFTEFTFELAADYNFSMAPGLERDHYVELSLVKRVTPVLSLNVQRVISSFEPESINQFGLRLSL
jgi:hypothetical protein